MESAIDNLDLEIQGFLQDGALMCAVGKELVERKDRRAIYWFRRARDLGCLEATCWMAWCLCRGFGTQKNVEMAESYIGKVDLEQVPQSFGIDRLEVIAVEIIDHYADCIPYSAEGILEFTYSRGSCYAAELLGRYYIYNWHDRNIDTAIKYLYPFRDKSQTARNLLCEAYMTCSIPHSNDLRAKGLFDESIIPEEQRHPRYWLSGNILYVKKCQFDDWAYFQRSITRNCGYLPHTDGIKQSWIEDCLQVMTPAERAEYLKTFSGLGKVKCSKQARLEIAFRRVDDGRTQLVVADAGAEDAIVVPDSWIMRIVDQCGKMFDVVNTEHDMSHEPISLAR